MKNFNVVLFEPEIPQNTGNIIRLCACTGCNLYLIGKLGFTMDEKHLKRSGLDYFDSVKIEHLNTLDELIKKFPQNNFYFLTTKYPKKYTETAFQEGDFFVFGPESRGIPENLLSQNAEFCRTIPMKPNKRSLNLSNSVAIVVYEAIRQCGI